MGLRPTRPIRRGAERLTRIATPVAHYGAFWIVPAHGILAPAPVLQLVLYASLRARATRVHQRATPMERAGIMRGMKSIFVTATFWMPLAGALVLLLVHSADAAVSDPAAIQVQTLTDALLKSMRAGSSESMAARYRTLEPVIEQVFALPMVTRLAVGPDWAGFSADDQKAVVAAFTRFTVANYAHNFRDYDGQKFEIDDNVVTRGTDKIVRSRVIPTHDVPVSLLYRMREVDGAWKIIDVYSNGVSELALRRADFAAALGAGGAPVLIAHLNKASDGLMK